jgi:hypothetical protein
MKRLALFLVAALLAACGNKPVAPDWQANAHGALERYERAFLSGATRAAEGEFQIARRELSATGDAGLVARAELTRCALQVASLVFEPCAGFETLRADAPAAERAYADYLEAKGAPADLLPPQHRAVAQGGGDAAALAAIADPMARMVAAGVVFRGNRASPEVLRLAADTASAQGWRRPLLAWLGAQLKLAEQRGDGATAERLRRRIELAASGAR